ncbi:regulator of nonsense transcripts 2-like [Tubulanus polymorphus]|uniref:regulator of nonsense transcripts 2-like n=1 Tax=Tubulanus polymorphus TaxID=672921 RepID=UPI003DA50828
MEKNEEVKQPDDGSEGKNIELIEKEEKETLIAYIKDVEEKIKLKAELRAKNSNAAENRPDSESFFGKLDSSLKKNRAFVKKVHSLSEAQRETLVNDFNALNLTKYIGEVASAITEAKLKMTDVGCAVYICSLLHQRYVEFSPALLENWLKVLPSKKEEKAINASKLRVDLRFFADLVAVRVFSEKVGLPVLSTQLSLLINTDKEEHNNLTIILSFCRHCGDDWAGLLARKIRMLSEKFATPVPRSQVLVADRQKACRNLIKDYYVSLSKHLVAEHKNLKNMERQNRKTLHMKGELTTERKEKFEAAQSAWQKLQSNAAQFADILDEDLPEFAEEENAENDGLGLDAFGDKIAEYPFDADVELFEDEETKAFYITFPDLKAMVPGILYRDSEQTTSDKVATGDGGGVTTTVEDESLNVEDVEKEIEKEMELEGSKKDEPEPVNVEVEADIDDDDTSGCMKLIFEAFIQSLPNCVNRELIDKAAIDFCMNLNTKANRKKLVRVLFTVQRTRYDLLPFYSRLVAILYPCMPDVSQELAQLLSSDFRWHVRKKDQINIESKLKTVRFIGELVKFNMFPKSDALHFLRMLMYDFSHHNIEMACSLLDTCGRFLYRSADSHQRTKVYLDVMVRKKAALHLDSRYTAMIENAYYYCNPPDTVQTTKKERPPMHEYIRKILYDDLTKHTVEKMLRQMRKLDWDDDDLRNYAAKCLTAVWNVRFNNVHCLANLLAGLAPFHENIAVLVVDGVLEDVRVGMEINAPKFNQRRVSTAKYLGELYNYRMVESAVVFKTLYSFITFGVSLDESVPSPLDQPEHLFRIRLVCVLLDTCGQFFDRGSSRKKLDYFLTYFQRYYLYKRSRAIWTDQRPFPMDVDNMVKDSLEAIRAKIALFETLDEANEAVGKIENEFKSKLDEALPERLSFSDDGNLAPIEETDEADEIGEPRSSAATASDDEGSTQESTEERSGSLSLTEQRLTAEDEHGDDEGVDDDYLSAGEDNNDDRCHVLTGGPKHMKCTEDDDFMSAFDKMMIDSLQARAQEAMKAPPVDIAMPMHLKGCNKAKKRGVITSTMAAELYGANNDSDASGILQPPDDAADDAPASAVVTTMNSINFTLMMKKGNKPQFVPVNVPVSATFATKFIEREQAERDEKNRLKRVVLDIHERQEEEDYQEMLAGMNRPPPVNLNRERRLKFQHPKGAPDADAIFGSKKF